VIAGNDVTSPAAEKPTLTRSAIMLGRQRDVLMLKGKSVTVWAMEFDTGRNSVELTIEVLGRPFRRVVTLEILDEVVANLQAIRDAARETGLLRSLTPKENGK